MSGTSETMDESLVVEELTASQSRLYAYIFSLTQDANAAWDLLQETNRVLWSRAQHYDARLAFMPWALKHAYNQVRSWRKQQQREKLVFRDEATLVEVERAMSLRLISQDDERSIALEHCVERLSENQRQLVHRFYHDGTSLTEIAESQSTRANTLSVMLHRIRSTLAECIKLRLE